MAGDDACTLWTDAKELADTLRHIAVASTVETIATDTVLLVHRVGDSIHVGVVWHGLMESGVKDANLRNVREDACDGINALQISGVVERSQVGERGKDIQHLFVEEDGLAEALTAVHHAMADSIQLAE